MSEKKESTGELIGCLCGKSMDIVKRAREGAGWRGADIVPMLDMLECAIAVLRIKS